MLKCHSSTCKTKEVFYDAIWSIEPFYTLNTTNNDYNTTNNDPNTMNNDQNAMNNDQNTMNNDQNTMNNGGV